MYIRGLKNTIIQGGCSNRAYFNTLLFILICTLLSALVSPNHIHALDIQWRWDPTNPPTTEQQNALEEAAGIWEGILDDPITVNIEVSFRNDPSGHWLGGTSIFYAVAPFVQVRRKMMDDAWAGWESDALALLPSGSTMPVLTGPGTVIDDDQCTVNAANLKALHFNVVGDTDATMEFNTAAPFDYNRGDGIGRSEYDFVTTILHELEHVFGFVSSTDYRIVNPEWENLHIAPLDFWRFEGETGDITNEARKCYGGEAYYSDTIWGHPLSWGESVVDPACGATGGICQASHWQDQFLSNMLMEPTIDWREVIDPVLMDRHALDMIGWDTFPLYTNCTINRCEIGVFNPEDPDYPEMPRQWLKERFPGFPPIPEPIPPRPDNADLLFALAIHVSAPKIGLDYKTAGVAWAEFVPPSAPKEPPPIIDIGTPQRPLRLIPLPLNQNAGLRFLSTISTVKGMQLQAENWPSCEFRDDGAVQITLNFHSDNAIRPCAVARLFLEQEPPPYGPQLPPEPPAKPDELYGRTLILKENPDNLFAGLNWPAWGIADSDGDNIPDLDDNCPKDYNPGQTDHNGDGNGDVCDQTGDADGDKVFDDNDPCPWDTDCDDDGISDGDEMGKVTEAAISMFDTDSSTTTDPANPDTDGDGILDGTERGLTLADVTSDTDPTIFVSDVDPSTTTDPTKPDTDGDGIPDGDEDANHNGGVDYGETDPASTINIVGIPIDIMPGSFPNCFNNDGQGVIPVAILSVVVNGEALFDATKVDASSVKLAGLAVKAVGKSGNNLLAHIEDVNGDGIDDMVVQIQDGDNAFEPGETMASITGTLLNGTEFEGFDSICIVP